MESSPSMPISSPSSISIPNFDDQNFNQMVKAQENFLISKYTNNQNENEKLEIVQLLSNILNDFYIAQEKLLGNNYNENADMKEAINQILTEIFFNEPFDKYTNKFYSVVKKSSRQ